MSNRLFTIDSKNDKHLQVNLLYVSKAKLGADWHSTMHSHYFTELFYITKGRGLFAVEKKEFPVEENDTVIINPGVSHTEKSAGDPNFEYVVIGIDGVSFEFNENPESEEYSVFSYKKKKESTDFFLNTLLSEADKDLPYRDAACQNIMELMVINILRRTNSTVSVESVKSVNRACRAAKRYIDENFRNPITLDELAAIAKVNKYYLSHAFASDYQISPINYLIGKRIEECKNLLASTNYSISHIAGFMGFSSPSYFSQCFKRNTGMRPETYRKKFRLSQMQNPPEEDNT